MQASFNFNLINYIVFFFSDLGVAIGAGWQAVVAYVNIACYYIFGVPLGLTLGFALDMGVKVYIISSYLAYCFLSVG